MTDAIFIALITGGLAVISNIVVAIIQNSVTVYRIDQLEKKVEKHNNLVERITIMEESLKSQWRRIDEFKTKLP